MYSSTGSNNGNNDANNAKTFVNAVQRQQQQHNAPLIGTVLTIPSPIIAQIVGNTAGGDFVMIDMEHAPMTIDIVTQMVHAYVSSSRGTRYPLVRIPSHGVEWVKWALDSGCAGLVVPMVGNVAEMKGILDRAIYPPGGRRSFGPISAPYGHPDGPGGVSGMGEYFARAKRGEIAILPMIESKEGLENVEEILALDGVSGTFIGPADLRLSMGLSAAIDGDEPEFVEAMKKIISTAKKLGKVVGTMGIGEDAARKRTDDGADFLLSSFDSGAMVNGLGADFAAARKGATGVRDG